MRSNIKTYLELGKIRISLLSMFSTGTGYLLGTGRLDWGILIPVIGILLLSTSACALNQVQDRDYDSKMNRTKNRPIPAGRIGLKEAWIYIILTFIPGSLILYFGSNLIALGLGWLAMIWYNGIYMYLKRKSSWAVVPGALIGSIPPLVGYAATGLSIFNPIILSFAFLFFIWQIPHFWLLLMNYYPDYHKAGLPSLTRIFHPDQLMRITFIWILATAVSGLLLPLYIQSPVISLNFILIFISFWLIVISVRFLFSNQDSKVYLKTFKAINLYILVLMLILSIGSLWFGHKGFLIFMAQR